MDEIRVSGGPSSRAGEAAEHERQRESKIRAAAEVPGDAGAVGDPVVAKARGRDDVDLDASFPDPLDGVDEKPTRSVSGVARVRGGEVDNFQREASRRAKTIGAASASSARA